MQRSLNIFAHSQTLSLGLRIPPGQVKSARDEPGGPQKGPRGPPKAFLAKTENDNKMCFFKVAHLDPKMLQKDIPERAEKW